MSASPIQGMLSLYLQLSTLPGSVAEDFCWLRRVVICYGREVGEGTPRWQAPLGERETVLFYWSEMKEGKMAPT